MGSSPLAATAARSTGFAQDLLFQHLASSPLQAAVGMAVVDVIERAA